MQHFSRLGSLNAPRSSDSSPWGGDLIADLPDELIFRNPCQAHLAKIILFIRNPNHPYCPPVPRSLQRRFAVVTKRGAGCGGRVGINRRVMRAADGEGVWSWSPDAGIKSRVTSPWRRGLSSPVPRGERAVSRNPLRGECRLFRLPCGCLRAQCASFSARKASGCGQHPAFPAPSGVQEGRYSCKARAQCVARAWPHASSLTV